MSNWTRINLSNSTQTLPVSVRITVIIHDVCLGESTEDVNPDHVLYTPERLEKIGVEAAKDSSVFSLNDRIGLLQDAFSLCKASLTGLSSCLTLVKLWKHEQECTPLDLYGAHKSYFLVYYIFFVVDLVWKAISNGLGELASIWWENPEVIDGLNKFRRVS